MFNPPVKQQRDKKGHPLFDAEGKPVMQTKDELGYDENGKKLHRLEREAAKDNRQSPSAVAPLTVDGMTGKAALNYEIKDLKYVYFYVPGIGTTVVSTDPFPGAVEQETCLRRQDPHRDRKRAHRAVILGQSPLRQGSASLPIVLVDKSFSVPTRFPVMGYGPIRVAPYAWPGSKTNEELKGVGRSLLPCQRICGRRSLLQPCPAGQMRKASQPILPGQTTPPPCVPIPQGQATTTSANQSVAPPANTQSQQ